MPISNRMLWAALAVAVAVAGCSTTPRKTVTPSPHYKVGNPYKVAGRWYYPKVDENYHEVGIASWYGDQFHGRLTANGEIFDMNRISAAHTTLPLPSMVEVQNLENGRRILVRVNDRGPFKDNRVIDLSRAAARQLGFLDKGLARVRVRYAGPARLADAAPKGGKDVKALRRALVAENPVPQEAPEADDIGNLIAAIEAVPEMTPGARTATIAQAAEAADIDTELEPVMVSAFAPEPPSSSVIDISKLDQAPPGDHQYIIKVGALSMLDNISGARSTLSQYGPLTLTREEPEGGEPVYRMKVGPFEDFQLAKARLEKVRAAGYGGAELVAEKP